MHIHKSIFSAVIVLTFLIAVPNASTQAVVDASKYPDILIVPKTDFTPRARVVQTLIIRIENPEGVRVGYHRRPRGATCAIGWNGVIIVAGTNKLTRRDLIVYTPSSSNLAEGECPSGTTAFISGDTFMRLRAQELQSKK